MHEISLITTIALALGVALLCGSGARRLGLSPIVGYLVAEVLIGPHAPGVSGDTTPEGHASVAGHRGGISSAA
jgi:CPA2 family monovalent cation:H+ antiporter-2